MLLVFFQGPIKTSTLNRPAQYPQWEHPGQVRRVYLPPDSRSEFQICVSGLANSYQAGVGRKSSPHRIASLNHILPPHSSRCYTFIANVCSVNAVVRLMIEHVREMPIKPRFTVSTVIAQLQQNPVVAMICSLRGTRLPSRQAAEQPLHIHKPLASEGQQAVRARLRRPVTPTHKTALTIYPDSQSEKDIS